MNQDLSLTLHNVNPNSWIIRAFQNLCMNPSYCTELDYNKGYSDMAGIVYNLYGDAMLGMGKGGGWPSLFITFAFNLFCRPANPGLFYL